jgi:hypothetical protein
MRRPERGERPGRPARLGRSAIALARAIVAVRLPLLLVLQHLAVELVRQHVDRGIHVGLDRLDVDVLAARVQVDLDLVAELLDRHDDVDIDHVVEVPGDALELRHDVVADRGRDVQLMAGEAEIHRILLDSRLREP